MYFQQNKLKKISGLQTLTKLEILDCAINQITEISGLDAQADTLDELWLNDNKIADWSSIDYMGKTLKKLNNLYIAVNPVYSRGQDFKDRLKQTVPCLTELEGVPFDRPTYYI